MRCREVEKIGCLAGRESESLPAEFSHSASPCGGVERAGGDSSSIDAEAQRRHECGMGEWFYSWKVWRSSMEIECGAVECGLLYTMVKLAVKLDSQYGELYCPYAQRATCNA